MTWTAALLPAKAPLLIWVQLAAAGVGHVDLAGSVATQDVIAGVAGCRVGRGTEGQGREVGAAEQSRVADHVPVLPLVQGAEDPPVTTELMTISLLLIGLTAKFDPPVNGHCGSGTVPGRRRRWIRPLVRPTPLTWKKSVMPPPQQGQLYW